jgi:hypothetical protein
MMMMESKVQIYALVSEGNRRQWKKGKEKDRPLALESIGRRNQRKGKEKE